MLIPTGNDMPAAFLINPDAALATTTTARSVTTTFSTSAQNVTLTATVTSAGGTVNDGTVQFSIVDSLGHVIGAATSGNVTNGSASVSYLVPGGTAAGFYTINAVYHPSTGSNFSGSADNTHSLSVLFRTTISLTSVNITPSFTNNTATVTLTAQVSSAAPFVDGQSVLFTMSGVSASAYISFGMASVQLTVPLIDVISSPVVTCTFVPIHAPLPIFTPASSSTTLYLNLWNGLLPSQVSFAAAGTQFNQIPLANQPFLAFSYSMLGMLTQININSLTFPVTYIHLSNFVLSEIGGLPWQLIFFNSAGQFQGLAQIALASDGMAQWLFYNTSGQVVGLTPI